jgi:hypothetical protein
MVRPRRKPLAALAMLLIAAVAVGIAVALLVGGITRSTAPRLSETLPTSVAAQALVIRVRCRHIRH